MALDANEDSCMMLKREWQRSPIVVARRNARERDRVYAAFVTLKYHLPAIRSNTKRVSKLKILQAAISYIAALTDLLRTDNVKEKDNLSKCYAANNCSKITTNNSTSSLKRSNHSLKKNIAVQQTELRRNQQHFTKTISRSIYDTAQFCSTQCLLLPYPTYQ